MRRVGISTLLLISACTGTQQIATTTSEQASTSSTGSESTSKVPPTTTTTLPATTTTLPPLQSLAYAPVADLQFPIQLVSHPAHEISYVITKRGVIWTFDRETVNIETPVLDLSGSVATGGEQGLLSMALHPTDPSLFYVHYSDLNGDTVVSEFTFANPDSERILLQVDQPASNHNGGMLQFAPDGTLLVGLGDGGGRGDRFGNSQNPDSLLGGLVAISVEGDPSPRSYAKGLRNPWRFWIDGGDFYVADVGQNAYEEISVTPLAEGLNYGWPITEGLHCFRPSSGCDTGGQVVPVMEVEHGDAGTCSITGGVVYRGTAIPELDGMYLYSDYCGGWLRSFRYQNGEALDQTDWTEQVGGAGNVVSFGVDHAGEAYVLTPNSLVRIVAVR
jgi:hypothetical protein